MPDHAAALSRDYYQPAVAARGAGVRQMYLDLSERDVAPDAADAAAQWLQAQLDAAGADEFAAWTAANTAVVGEQYKQYRSERKAGAPRRYFGSKAHALHFLKGVAPTKLVDGAWLFGLLKHWEDGAMRPLITTYLDELGNSVPTARKKRSRC